MGRRDRERRRRILHGEEAGYRQQAEEAALARKLDALERIAEKFGGTLVAEELSSLSQKGKLRI